MKRSQEYYLFDEQVNAGKMIFLFGPRQVGKTTLVKNKLSEMHCQSLYFNWDDPLVKRTYIKNPHFLKSWLAKVRKKYPLVAFDEIHKHKNWKNILKGLYDIHNEECQFIITGSARLDYFKRSGDSLVGRYFSYRLLPIGLSEAVQDFNYIEEEDSIFSGVEEKKLLEKISSVQSKKYKEAFNKLMKFGGFPELFIKGNTRFSNKWRRDYKNLLITEELRDLTRINDIKGIEQLLLLLTDKIGSPISINSLLEDLQVNYRTVENWLEAFKKIYLVFSIMPWTKKISRAIKKAQKYYFFDWPLVKNKGAQFENAVAVFLLRLISRWNELGIGNYELRYI